VRILRKRYKALYIFGGYAVIVAINLTVGRQFPVLVGAVLSQVLSIAHYAVGIRTFRGPEERIEPPRAWWRATARPTAGYWIGIASIIVWPLNFGTSHPAPFTPEHLVTGFVNLVVGVYYLNSSIRLSRLFARARRISDGGETPSAAVRALALANAPASTVDAVFAMPRLRFAVAGDPADPSGFALTTADGVIRFLVAARYTDRRGVERALEQDAYAAAHRAGIEAMRPEEVAPLPDPA
jgi:hypothetical protein